MLLLGNAVAALMWGVQQPGPTVPADGNAPDAALVQAVRSVEPYAERISYWPLGDATGGIPSPAEPDKAVVEFDISGLTCKAYVSGRAQDRPIVDETTCGHGALSGLTERESASWGSFARWGLAAAIFAAFGFVTLVWSWLARPTFD